MELTRLVSCVPAAAMAVLPSPLAPHATFVFLGSRVADSLLLQLGSGGAAAVGGDGGERAAKRARAEAVVEEEEYDEEERRLFGSGAAAARPGGGAARRLPLLLRDSLVSAAPTSDVAISPDLSLAPRAEDDEAGAGAGAAGGAREAVARLPKELLLCGGRGRSGSLR